MAEVRKDALRLGGEGASLVHGHAYNIASFGLGLSVDRDFQGKDKHQMDVSHSDAPDQPQMLDWDNGPLRARPKFLVYE